jgi:hypothetical protein
VVNAVTGAAIGAGTKLLVDKITGKPITSSGTGTKVPKTPPSGSKVPSAPAGGTKPPPAGNTKPTSVVKPPVINTATGKPTGTGFGDDQEEFTTDSLGNTYKTMPDGTSVLYRAAEVDEDIDTSTPTTGGADGSNTPTFEPEYFEDSLGNIYISTADGEYDLYRAAEVDEDVELPPDTSSEPEYFEDSLGNLYIQGDSGEYELYRAAEVPEDILEEDYDLFNQNNTEDFDVNDRYSTEEDDGDEYYDYRRGGLTTMMNKGGVAKFEDGGYVDNGDGTYTIGNYTYDMMTDEYLYSTDSGNITNVNPDAIYSTTPEEDYYDTDSLGNVFKNGKFYRAAEVPEDITSISNVGSGETNTKKDVYQTDADGNVFKNGVFYRAADVPEAPTGGIGSDFLNTITGALGTTAGAAGAGALIASLLGSDFSGGSGAQNQGVDMSQVGIINPRTTDFGIGPTNFVGYEDYGTNDGDYTPNEELLRNLNAPGYNPVNEGDYGYEEFSADETTNEGGLAAMAGGGDAMAAWVAAQPDLSKIADPMTRAETLESWQKQRPGYVDPMNFDNYEAYAGAAGIQSGKDEANDLTNRANFYGMTTENYQNALSGDKTKPMGQFQQVYGNELLSPVEQLAAQTARAQGLGAPSKLAVEQMKKNPSAFNEASKKWHDYMSNTFPKTAEYSSVLAGPMEYSATGVKAPKITGTETAYIIDPKTKMLVKNPRYKPFKMASGGLSSMATPVASYYTYGQPADILANLGMRAQPPMNPPEMMPQIGQQKPPQQMQQQGLPQQMPPQMAQQVPQGMPQQGMMPQQQGMPPPMRKGGLPHASNVPMVEGRMDFRKGSAVHGAGDGQSDDIPAMLADGEYVIDAETVAQIGNGSTKAGAQALDKFRESIRAHKRSAPVDKIPPKTKALTSYLKGAR